jgi:hypothetical protein
LVESGIKINDSKYGNIVSQEVISQIQDLKIINGNINYNKIDECVPIEVYMWYEWLPTTFMQINTYYKGTFTTKNIQFIDYRDVLKIPIFNPEENTKIKRLTFLITVTNQLMLVAYSQLQMNLILQWRTVKLYVASLFQMHAE